MNALSKASVKGVRLMSNERALKTNRLVIQKLKAEDYKSLKAIAADFGKSEYAVYDIPLPTEDDKIKPLCEQFAASGLWFAVWFSEKMIGYICFHQNGTVFDLGFCFHSDYHGQGFAFEACYALMEHIEKERNATAFTAGTALKNAPSCKLLKKLGFVLKETEALSFHKDKNGNEITFEGGIFVKKVSDIICPR